MTLKSRFRKWWYGFDPEVDRTLQARYPAAPGAYVTSYSSIHLTDEAFVSAPRQWCPTCQRLHSPDLSCV